MGLVPGIGVLWFSEDYGVVSSSEYHLANDYGVYHSELAPLRAVIHTSQGPPNAPRNEDGLYQTSFEYDDY